MDVVNYLSQAAANTPAFLASHYLLIIFATGWLMLMRLLASSRRYLAMALVFVPGAFWLSYSASILHWAAHLGTDSFDEALDFDWHEAWFLIKSLRYILHFARLSTILPILGYALVLAWVLRKMTVSPRFSRPAFRAVYAMALIGLPLYAQATRSMVDWDANRADFHALQAHFHDHRAPSMKKTADAASVKPVDVVVYIGESTTMMNMGLYGYPRNTTPLLQKRKSEDTGLLVFHNVFSTHTHTSPSLLEALSIGMDSDEKFLTIRERKRTSVVDLLREAGIPSLLWSNQSNAGTWSQASTIVFQNAAKKVFSRDATMLGNEEGRLPRPKDHHFFANSVTGMTALKADGARVAFLHSYAGHMDYLPHIDPAFHGKVDGYLAGLHPAAIAGDQLGSAKFVNEIEEYDSAIRYIDFSLDSGIQQVRAAHAPTVFVYFSDHGESAYTGRNHDSARFVYEMLRVPFLIYFNDAARLQNPKLFKQFEDAAQSRKTSTLAQFPATLLRLLGYESPDGLRGVGLDDEDALPPLFVRRTAEGYSHMTVSAYTAGADAARPTTTEWPHSGLATYRASRALQYTSTRVCQQGSNTLATALRGALAAHCLEAEVTVQPDGLPSAHDAASPHAQLPWNAIADIARQRARSLWVNARNIDVPDRCTALAAFFAGRSDSNETDILVEFPSTTNLKNAEIRSCANTLRSHGMRTAFAMPERVVAQCAAAEGNPEKEPPAACDELVRALSDVEQSNLFSDISFGFAGLRGMERVARHSRLQWNMRGVDAVDIPKITPTRFRMIAANSDDPNSR